MPPVPLSLHTCFIQKPAAELLSNPSKARWSSSVAVAGNLMVGAWRLNTFPPWSSTKWLCVATKGNVMERAVQYLFGKNIE
jgi:hypothetical protein